MRHNSFHAVDIDCIRRPAVPVVSKETKMIKMNFYMHGKSTVSTADTLKGCAHSLSKIADNMENPNEVLRMISEMFDVVTREKVAEKIEGLAAGLFQCAADLKGPVIDERPHAN
jgi:hypothetical protein